MGERRTRVFCCRALCTNARCMSFLIRSSCLILEFVAMGRDGPPSSRTDEDGFRPALLPASDDDLRGNLSNIGDFGWNSKSICLELRAFGER